MFTIKYVWPDGREQITGPYALVNAGWVDFQGNALPGDCVGVAGSDQPTPPRYMQVIAHQNVAEDLPGLPGPTMTYGPNVPVDTQPIPTPWRPARLYVMNEHGATVAKYEL